MISALIRKTDGRRIAGSRVAQNMAALYGVQFGRNRRCARNARNRDCPAKCGEVMAGVLGSQALFAVCGLTLALTVARSRTQWASGGCCRSGRTR